MDKKTLSHYGWMVIVTLVLAIMLAFATPFGTYVGDATVSFVTALFHTQDDALDDKNINNKGDKFDKKFNEVQANLITGNKCQHKNTVLQNVKEATCGHEGYSGDYYCNDCKQIAKYGKATARLEHKNIVIQNAIAGDCNTKSFSGNKVCLDCNTIIEKGTYSKNNAHQPIYAGLGMVHTKCKVCGMELNEEHEFTETVKEKPTCSKVGTTLYSCVCGFSYSDPNIPTVEHKPIYGGTKEIHEKCVWCNKVISTNHTYTLSGTIEATCGEPGNITYTCACGYSYNEQTDKIGHTLTPNYLNVNYVAQYDCSRCGAAIIPEGATYYVSPTSMTLGDYSGATATLVGDGKTVEFPKTPNVNDTYVYKGYEYRYKQKYNPTTNSWVANSNGEWSVKVLNKDSVNYQPILSTIVNKKLTDMSGTFYNCTSLTTAPAIPDTVTNMYNAFNGCASLVNTPTISNSVTSMSNTFRNCTSLTTAPVIPNSVTNMIQTFNGCTSLTTPPDMSNANSVTDMYQTFYGCKSLTAAPTIPNSVTSMYYTFYGCRSLTTPPTIPNSVTNMIQTFNGCTSLTTPPTIPNSVTNMIQTFNGCTSLTTAPTIPNSVTNMQYTFENCTQLTGTIEVNANPTTCTDCFKNTTKRIYLTGSSTKLNELAATDGYTDLSSKDNVRTIVGNGIIPDGAVYTPNGGTAITGNGTNTFPDTPATGDTYEEGDYIYKYNQYYSGSSWYSNTSQNGWGVRVKDNSKTSYGDILSEIAGKPITNMYYTFFGCYDLTTAPVIPNSVTNMQATFYKCSSLATAPTIPNSVANMNSTFFGCTKLTTAPIIPNSVKSMYATFRNCTSLTTAPAIPNSVMSMYATFVGCTSLTTAPTIPNSVTNMLGTFQNCTSLTTAPVIPNSVTDMGDTFAGCKSLTTAPVIPNSVTSMGWTFNGCTSLTIAPAIPNSVTNMGHTFYGCTSLTTAPTIPNSVTNMQYTFENCTQLTGTITINANPTSYNNCFYNTVKPITIVGYSPKLSELATTDNNNNVNLAVIPSGGVYKRGGTTYSAGQNFPTVVNGDIYEFNDYRYKYRASSHDWDYEDMIPERDPSGMNGSPPLETINGIPVYIIIIEF